MVGSQSGSLVERGDVVDTVNATINAAKNTTLTGSYFYRAPTKIERGEFSSQRWRTSRSAEDHGREGDGLLTSPDPFNTMGMKIRTGDDTSSR